MEAVGVLGLIAAGEDARRQEVLVAVEIGESRNGTDNNRWSNR